MKAILFLLSSLLALPFSQAIAQDNFSSLLNELSNLVEDVQVEKGLYKQKLAELEPGIVSFQSDLQSTKGKVDAIQYKFNLADIDKYTVKEITNKDLIYVQLRVVQNQKFIHVTENGEVKPYKSEVRICAKDIDNAREIAAIVLKMIEEANEILKNRINASNYEEYLNFLEQNIGDVNTSTAAVAQSFKPAQGIGGLVEIKVTESGKKSTDEYLYNFNVADLNEHGLKVIVKSTEVRLEIPTFNKLKLIKVSKNGEHLAFQSEITLDFATIDLARDVRVVLGEFIPQAKEKLKKDMPDFKTTEQITSAINEQLEKVEVGTKTVTQNFSSTCVPTLQVEEGSSSETDIFQYKFNFSDINPASVNYKIAKSKMQVELETNAKEKLIKKVQNGEQQAYTNKLLLDCRGTEQARMLIYSLKAMIDKCKAEQSEISVKGTAAKVDWLKENIKEISLGKKVLQQSFRETDERTKFEFKQVTVSGSSSNEVLYVFNATDIDQSSISFKISGKNLSIEVKSNQRAKIFKSYKDGGVVNYVNEFEIYFDEVETAKDFIVVLKGLKEDLE